MILVLSNDERYYKLDYKILVINTLLSEELIPEKEDLVFELINKIFSCYSKDYEQPLQLIIKDNIKQLIKDSIDRLKILDRNELFALNFICFNLVEECRYPLIRYYKFWNKIADFKIDEIYSQVLNVICKTEKITFDLLKETDEKDKIIQFKENLSRVLGFSSIEDLDQVLKIILLLAKDMTLVETTDKIKINNIAENVPQKNIIKEKTILKI